MKTVLRNEEGIITHHLFCFSEGKKVYVTQEQKNAMFDLSFEEIKSFFDGNTELAQSYLFSIVTQRDDSKNVLYKIACSIGVLKKENVVLI